MKRIITVLVITAILSLMIMAGCNTEENFGLSENVKFLWQQHPNPWTETAAKAAAEDAKGLLAKHKKDFQLHLYYQGVAEFFDSEGVVKEYEELLAKDTTNARNIVLEANAAGGRNRTKDRMEVALVLAPEDPYVLAFAAKALLRSRPAEPDRAFAYGTKALEIAPDLAYAHEALAFYHMQNKEFDQAIASATIANEIYPSSFAAIYILLNCYDALERGEEGLALLEEFASSQPLHSGAIYYLEKRYRDSDQLEKIVDFKRVAAISDPDDGYNFIELASIFSELDQKDSLLAALEHAVDNDFMDINYAKMALGDEGFASISGDRRFQSLQVRMKKMLVDSRPERREEALKDKLDIVAPEVIAIDLKGNEVSLADLRGEIIILDFWATWCGPCKMTVPRLIDYYETNPDAKLISLNVWERPTGDERRDLVSDFTKEEGMKWNIWLGENTDADAFEVTGIPTFLVIDRDGLIRYRIVGYIPFLDEVLGWMVEDVDI